MNNVNLTNLLKEYEQKKLYAERTFYLKLQELYSKVPRLQEIDSEINRLGFLSIRSKLSNTNADDIESILTEQNKLKHEKLELLKKLNIDINKLKPTYSCNICNDTGFITDNNYKQSKCSCLKQKLLNTAFDNSNLVSVHKQNFTTFDEKVYSDVANNKEQLSPRQNIMSIRNDCIEFVKNFDNEQFSNLMFSGKTGLRKNFYI